MVKIIIAIVLGVGVVVSQPETRELDGEWDCVGFVEVNQLSAFMYNTVCTYVAPDGVVHMEARYAPQIPP